MSESSLVRTMAQEDFVFASLFMKDGGILIEKVLPYKFHAEKTTTTTTRTRTRIIHLASIKNASNNYI